MHGARQKLRLRLMGLAGAQRGYFTAAQALRLGYTYQAQKFHVDRGNWVRVDRGLFRIPEWPIAEDDHLVRWTLWSKGKAVVSHATALATHGFGDVDPAQVHLSVPSGFRRKVEGLVLHRQHVPESQVEDRGGYRISDPSRAIAECAAEGMSQELLDGTVAEAMAAGRATRQRLRSAAAELGPRAELGVERALQAAVR